MYHLPHLHHPEEEALETWIIDGEYSMPPNHEVIVIGTANLEDRVRGMETS